MGPYAPDRHPIYIHEDAGGTQVYGFPAIDGPDGGARVAFLRHGTPCSPDTIDREVHPAEVAFMAERLAAVLPTLPGRYLTAASCMYTTTPDQHFVIAQHQRHAAVTVACGFSGHGFKFVPVVGEILADLATTGTTKHPIALFDPRRPWRPPEDHDGRDPRRCRAAGCADQPSADPARPVLHRPGRLAREQTRVFEAMWCCAVRSAELADPGSFRRVQVGRESVLVVRGRDGELRAFINVCRHRGALLCTEESGQTKRTLSCPYHAWSYGLDGTLVGAPDLRNMPDVDRVAHGLVPVQLRGWLGYAWVCLADEPPSFEREVQGAVTERLGDPAAIEGYGVERLTLGRRIRYDVRANWKLIVENFMECYHCATIHPELTHVLPEFARGYAAQSFVGHGAEFAPDTQGFTVDGGAGFPVLPGVGAD